ILEMYAYETPGPASSRCDSPRSRRRRLKRSPIDSGAGLGTPVRSTSAESSCTARGPSNMHVVDNKCVPLLVSATYQRATALFSEEWEGGVTMSVRVQALLVGLAAIAAAALNAGFPWD